MKRAIVLTAGALLVAALAIAAESGKPAIYTPKQVAWGAGPPFLPAGVKFAVLEGDPTQAGDYTIRLSMPDGYKIPAHSHPTVENVTVVSGEFHAGMGDKLDRSKAMTLPAGSFASLPAQMNHFAWAKGRTVVQVHGTGPFAITYVNPADDPRNAKKP
jgi:quercetin dioxygenase-like cupin family protein